MSATKLPRGGAIRSSVPVLSDQDRLRKLQHIGLAAFALLFLKVLLSILYEYRWYFPANFEAAFLIGREDVFVGLYRVAFYVHIVSSPVALVCGAFLMTSGGNRRFRHLHRYVGRIQILMVILAVAPSGFVMVLWAHTGTVAAIGFVCLSVGTATTATFTVVQAFRKQFRSHQQWATRLFILLASPLLLRLITGAVIVTRAESELSYQLTAWLSWLAPLVIYELWLVKSNHKRSFPAPRQTRSLEGALP